MISAPFPFDSLRKHFNPPKNDKWRKGHPEEEVIKSLRQYQRQTGLIRPTSRRKRIYIQPMGDFTPGMSAAIDVSREALTSFFQLQTFVLPVKPSTCVSEVNWRNSPFEGEDWLQANADYILDHILTPVPPAALIVTGIVPFDLWPGDHFNFVYGLASLESRVAVSSLRRLGDFNGPTDVRIKALLNTVKIVIHEVAHSFTLDHCVEYACCLNGSNDEEESESQPLELCPSCLQKLSWNIDFDPLRHLVEMQRLCSRWGFRPEAQRFEELIAAATKISVSEGKPRFIVSAHGDHNFTHAQVELRDSFFYGTLDNFVGVKAVMDACFDGSLNGARVEITYGEETGMKGACEVAATVGSEDIVVVVDVTGYLTEKDLVIEKCSDPWMNEFIRTALSDADFTYEIFFDCGDPICQIDETNVYKQRTERCILLGIPCDGGDYNSHAVRCKPASIRAASQALKLMFRHFQAGKSEISAPSDNPATALCSDSGLVR